MAVCACVAPVWAAVNIDAPIPVLRLKDGRELKEVVFVSYSPTTIMAKWNGGRGTIAYNLLPDDVAVIAGDRRPAPRKTDPAVLKRIEAERLAQEQAAKQKAATAASVPEVAPMHSYKGSVYISTKGGSVYKLAGLQVLAIEAGDFRAIYEKWKVFGESLDDRTTKEERLISQIVSSGKCVAVGTTGPDGQFTLNCEQGDVFLVAQGRRLVGSTWERYYWTVRARSGEPTDLTNSNMLN